MGTEPGPAPVRIALRPISSPLGLGFLALAGAAVLASSLQLGWTPAGERGQVGLLVLVFTPVPQLLASVFGFLARDPVAATGMGVVAAGWTARGAVLLVSAAGSRSDALGTLELLIAAAVAISALEAAGGTAVVAAVMSLTALDFLLSGLQELGVGELATAVGVVGVALAAVALYAAAALALEDLRRRTVLPTGRRGGGRRALHGDLADQLEGVAHEAGVRRQL
ncbi:hypothetical protein FSW04_12345 [Baekduia soli]|uniref:Uncharacterized protein n=1 Tax=Baekduia soli TaxID=496014 RepID=A0A5B8U581_9ACTN|nr:hypothetical protein [Baekduia soli]QEC48279.1 hypothetical protein FSW04_12345 [Baekduia soli]